MHPQIAKSIVDTFQKDTPSLSSTNEAYASAVAETYMLCLAAQRTNNYKQAADAVVAFYNRFW